MLSNAFSDLDEYVEEGRNGFLAKGISLEDIDRVLLSVAVLSREQIEKMHSYTKQQNRFDYRKYSGMVIRFFQEIIAEKE